ncbi:MAG: histidine phosphatase family protein, partial [Bifidobacteriaceae bacterium]|nr:histidine phosphatase family protein [Bifidobacteriaceae bacterium]
IPKNPFRLAPLVYNPFRPSWGEKYTDILERMLAFMSETAKKENGKQVICISHQTPIWVLHRYFDGKTLWHNPAKRFTTNCSITSFVFSSDTENPGAEKLIQKPEYFEPV